MIKPIVKICCISSVEEALTAIEYGASVIGLVGNMPSGPGVIDDELIKEIAMKVPSSIATFLLTSENMAANIINHHRKVNTSAIQIVDELKERDYDIIRNALPQVKLVQVIHVINERSIDDAIEISTYVDAILLDSGNPNLSIKELGGTGRVHDWAFSRRIRESVNVPVFLAGGLNNENVKRAVEIVEPFGIDVCSGVRSNGNLDMRKLESFFKAIG